MIQLSTHSRQLTSRSLQRSRRGITLIEVAVSSILVGTIIVASLRTVGAVARFRGETADEQRAVLLADELLTRILKYEYDDPDNSPVLGREILERLLDLPFDDMDDFDGWSQSPPAEEDGTSLPGFSDWGWSVSVAYVNPSNLSATGTDQGAKLITIRIEKNQVTVAEVRFVKADIDAMEPVL